MELKKQDVGVWVNLSKEFPEDWEITSMRYMGDHYPVENSLFEDREGALCKIGGTGRLEYDQVEWLKPIKDVYMLSKSDLHRIMSKYRNHCTAAVYNDNELLEPEQFLESIKQ